MGLFVVTYQEEVSNATITLHIKRVHKNVMNLLNVLEWNGSIVKTGTTKEHVSSMINMQQNQDILDNIPVIDMMDLAQLDLLFQLNRLLQLNQLNQLLSFVIVKSYAKHRQPTCYYYLYWVLYSEVKGKIIIIIKTTIITIITITIITLMLI